MNANSLSQNPQFREFFETVAPWLPAYRYRLFTFVGLVTETEDIALRASLHLSTSSNTMLRPPVRTQGLRAGQEWIEGPPEGTESFLIDGIGHRFTLREGVLALPAEAQSGISAALQVPQLVGIRNAPYVARLSLGGKSRWELLGSRQTRLERELLSLQRPFRSLAAWTAEYGFQLSSSDCVLLEVFADRVAWIDSSRSHVRGTNVEVVVHLAAGLDPSGFRLAVSNTDPDGVRIEDAPSATPIQWSIAADHTVAGLCRFEIPEEAILCVAPIYGGCVQEEVELADVHAVPNRRRMMVEVADAKLLRLTQLLTEPKGQELKDFEGGVALLLHMLGFSTAYVSALSDMRDEADMYGLTPSGDVIIVECTTGVPNDEKFGKLINRVAQARKSLCTASSRLPPERVTPIMVTTRTREDIGAHVLHRAQAHGVLVLCRLDIEAALLSTRWASNADAALTKWRHLPLMRILPGEG